MKRIEFYGADDDGQYEHEPTVYGADVDDNGQYEHEYGCGP